MPFPLEDDQYFGLPDDEGLATTLGVWVVQIRKAFLGLKPSALYDAATAQAVRDWQEMNGLPVTGRVGRTDWELLFPEGS